MPIRRERVEIVLDPDFITQAMRQLRAINHQPCTEEEQE